MKKYKTSYRVYDPNEGYVYFATFELALKYANELLDICRTETIFDDMGWDSETENIVIEKCEVVYAATQVNRVDKPDNLDEDDCDENGEQWDTRFDYICDYQMLPIKQNQLEEVI